MEYKWKGTIWDKGITIKLLVKFMKEHHLMHQAYLRANRFLPIELQEQLYYPPIDAVGKLFLKYGKNTRKSVGNGIPCQEDLVLSQLWKFYVLERISQYPQKYQKSLIESLRFHLLNNGTRGSKEVEKLFKIHRIEY